jgi:sialate O-acetylesterase
MTNLMEIKIHNPYLFIKKVIHMVESRTSLLSDFRITVRRGPICMILTACMAWVFMTGLCQAEVRLPAIFSDQMILQQQRLVPIWGWSEPDEKVSIRGSWSELSIEAVGNSEGKWKSKLPTPVAGGPFTVTVQGTNKIVSGDVLTGEVWICSGQSNMWWPVSQAKNPQEEITAANYPSIRLFTVAQQFSTKPQSNCGGTWKLCNPETVGSFSAVGYFFGRELFQELDVPIGLINISWGGSLAEAWTSEATLREFGKFTEDLDLLNKPETQIHDNFPTVMYNAMLAPVIPFSMQGVIWYQGEANRGRAKQYRRLFPALIGDWRNLTPASKVGFRKKTS